jgi:hypothetical protein
MRCSLFDFVFFFLNFRPGLRFRMIEVLVFLLKHIVSFVGNFFKRSDTISSPFWGVKQNFFSFFFWCGAHKTWQQPTLQRQYPPHNWIGTIFICFKPKVQLDRHLNLLVANNHAHTWYPYWLSLFVCCSFNWAVPPPHHWIGKNSFFKNQRSERGAVWTYL